MLDKESVREIARKYADKVREVLNPASIVIFGSYINGTPHEYSDIDIAVIMNDYQGDWLQTYSMLFALKRHINLDIEPHLLDEAFDRSGFVEHVVKTGEYVYKSA